MNKGDAIISLVIVVFLSYVHLSISRSRDILDYRASSWAEQMLSKMSVEEKIGQTLMPMACLNGDDQDLNKLRKELRLYHVGGVLVFPYNPKKGPSDDRRYDPGRQAAFLNLCQRESRYPLLVAADAEWGLGMRFKGAMSFPRNMTLGSLADDSLVFEAGKEIGRQCKAVGVHVNFAPVIDINSNPNNPIIGNRSFGDDENNIVNKAVRYMKGMRQSGVIACVKHFPGHGDTSLDSHKVLPTVTHSEELLRKRELVPFKKVFSQGVDSVMVAHLYVPAFQGPEKKPSSLSREVVTDLLKRELLFSGLIFSDSFAQMKAITDNFAPGDAEVEALRAGVDMIVDVTDIGITIEKVKAALAQGTLSYEELDTKVLKILKAKEALSLHTKRFIKEPTWQEVFPKSAYALRHKLYKQALTLVQGSNHIVSQDSLVVSVGDNNQNKVYQKSLANYSQCVELKPSAGADKVKTIMERCQRAKSVVIALFPKQNRYGRAEGFSPAVSEFLQTVSAQSKDVVAVVFASPYVLNSLTLPNQNLVIAYEDTPDAVQSFFEMIRKKHDFLGKNPVPHALSPKYA